MTYLISGPSRTSGALAIIAILGILLTPRLMRAPPSVQAASKPNIVVIVVDDLDLASFETLRDQRMTPNFERYVAGLGTTYRFTNNFVTRASCGPSRATLLTGQYAHNHHVRSNNPPLGSLSNFNEWSTVATWMKAAGYRTGLVGKYLNGYGLTSPMTLVPPGWDYWQALLESTSSRSYSYLMNDNGWLTAFGTATADFQADVLAAKARRFILESQSPFFLYIAPSAPHLAVYPKYNECSTTGSPWEFVKDSYFSWGHTVFPAPRHQGRIFGDFARFALRMTPSFNEADLSDKPVWMHEVRPMRPEDVGCLQKNHWRRLESMLAVDDLIGKVFQTLGEKQQGSNTIVMFTSDNGLFLGEHRLLHKGPLYEEALRVPLYIALPIAGGGLRNIDQLTLNNDLAPTIAAFGGARPALTVDGRTLTTLMQNPAAAWRKRFLAEHWFEASEGHVQLPDCFGVRTGSPSPAMFVEYPTVSLGKTREFFDLAIDPYQLENVESRPERQQQVSAMAAKLAELRSCSGVSCIAAEDSP